MKETEIFQHYQVLRREDGSLWKLGVGGMGVTYKAFDTNLRCFVALKVISAQYLHSELARQRFVREARAAAQLRHRNVATVYHLGIDPENFFYSMEFVDGETLETVVKRTGPLPPDVVMRIGLQAARALAAAAKHGLIHRDIKPANLMVLEQDEDGEEQLLVKVIDFGLARTFGSDDPGGQLTGSGFLGTPQYASPEQLEEKPLDARSDIYSLGVSLWFLLTGRPLFEGKLTHLINQHLSVEPPWPELGDCPAPVRDVLERMLQKQVDRRPQTAGELRREIESCLRTLDGVPALPPETSSSPSTGWHLPRPRDEEHRSAPGHSTVGTVGGRFDLLRLAGEGHSSKVYQARDLLDESRSVAAKVYQGKLFAAPAAFQRLCEAAAQVRTAPHPALLQIYEVERFGTAACLLMEWGGGHTLVDVLRQRRRLPAGDALALLRQAAAAADHAHEHGLAWLGLDAARIFILPPAGTAAEKESAPAGAPAKIPLAGQLKIDALAELRGTDDIATWAGGHTLAAPPPAEVRGQRGAGTGQIAGGYLPRLAKLFHELLSGTPPRSAPSALPGIGEAANEILRRALADEAAFASNLEFYEKLARAEDLDPDSPTDGPVVQRLARTAGKSTPPRGSGLLAAEEDDDALSPDAMVTAAPAEQSIMIDERTIERSASEDAGLSGSSRFASKRSPFPKNWKPATVAAGILLVAALAGSQMFRHRQTVNAVATGSADVAVAPPVVARVVTAMEPVVEPAHDAGPPPANEPSFLLQEKGNTLGDLTMSLLSAGLLKTSDAWEMAGSSPLVLGRSLASDGSAISGMVTSSVPREFSEQEWPAENDAILAGGTNFSAKESRDGNHSASSARRRQAPRPNLLQRILGLRPKR